MNKTEIEARHARDTLAGHEAQHRRYPPMRTAVMTGVWSPRLTDEEKAAQEKYIRDENLPF